MQLNLIISTGLVVLISYSIIARANDIGAVASPDQYGAATAEYILRSGGNAVDAGIATAFTLAVTLPYAGNIGGGGFSTIYFDGQPYFLDYREVAPAAATETMFLDEYGNVIENMSLIGAKSSGVPGTVMGLWEAHQKFGSLPWHTLVQPAIEYAELGYQLSELQAKSAVEARDDWFKGHTNFSDFYGATTMAGDIFKQPDLAATLKRIANQGPDDFYYGETAALLVAQMEKDNGLITLEDLANYRAQWRSPVIAHWRDKTVITAPPPSSGGIALVQMLEMKEVLRDLFNGIEVNSAEYVHLMAEIEKRAFADRAEYLGDPDFFDVPVGKLIDKNYIASRAADIRTDTISPTASVKPGLESAQTTHFSILDKEGNGFSNTYTLNWSFGSGVLVEGAGFLLNDEMDDFSSKPGVPNIFGVIGGEANAISPRKRMLSSMTPTLVVKDGELVLIAGSPGGSTIITTVFQVINNLYDHDMTAQDAVSLPRFHHQLFPVDQITMEPYAPLSESEQRQLRLMGYTVHQQSWDLGDAQIIFVGERGIEVGADPRAEGVARLFEY